MQNKNIVKNPTRGTVVAFYLMKRAEVLNEIHL